MNPNQSLFNQTKSCAKTRANLHIHILFFRPNSKFKHSNVVTNLSKYYISKKFFI